MPVIKIKNSTTASSTPASLVTGEMAVNIADQKTFIGNASGVTTKIVDSLGVQDANNVNITGGSIDNVSLNNSSQTLSTSNLVVGSGQTITAIDNDTTLAANSSSRLPTQNAVVGYINSKKGALKNIYTFTSNGTYTKSGPDVTRLRVICVGAGGGGRGYSEAGGAGGMSELIIDATGISTVSVTVGSGAGGGVYFGFSGQGGSTSFGSYCSASGGCGSSQNYQHSGGHGGYGYGGNMNIHGGGGSGHKNDHSNAYHNGSGHGGQSFFGGANNGHHYSSRYAQNIQAFGAGGGGHNSYFVAGYDGMYGVCVVYEYR
jgi:hypothetical protein